MTLLASFCAAGGLVLLAVAASGSAWAADVIGGLLLAGLCLGAWL